MSDSTSEQSAIDSLFAQYLSIESDPSVIFASSIRRTVAAKPETVELKQRFAPFGAHDKPRIDVQGFLSDTAMPSESVKSEKKKKKKRKKEKRLTEEEISIDNEGVIDLSWYGAMLVDITGSFCGIRILYLLINNLYLKNATAYKAKLPNAY